MDLDLPKGWENIYLFIYLNGYFWEGGRVDFIIFIFNPSETAFVQVVLVAFFFLLDY